MTDDASCWIGLNDADNEGTFVWTDGTPNDYQRECSPLPSRALSFAQPLPTHSACRPDWNSGEPNAWGGEDSPDEPLDDPGNADASCGGCDNCPSRCNVA